MSDFMSFVSVEHNPDPAFGCEFTAVSTYGQGEQIVTKLGALGCTVGETRHDISHEMVTAHTYAQVHDILTDFRDGHRQIKEEATSTDTEDVATTVFTEADLSPEDLRYRRAAEFLSGKRPMPSNVDKGMLLQALMDGAPDIDTFLAGQESTIAG